MAYQGRQGPYSGSVRPAMVAPAKRSKVQKPRRKVRWGRLLLVLMLFSVVMSLIGLAGYGFYLERKIVVPAATAQAPLPKEGPVYILIAGLDRDPNSPDPLRQQLMNTDALILARIDQTARRATLLLIPPDTRVELPTGMSRINAAYATGGMDRLKQTVTELTGLPIDRYVLLDFPAFAAAVDALGGIEFFVDKPVKDPEGTVQLPPGTQTLNGRAALAVARDREGTKGDIARLDRQQKLLQALLEKWKRTDVVDWLKGVRAMSDTLCTDMSIREMGMLVTALQGETTTFTTQMVPGEFLNIYGVSYWKVDKEKLQALVQTMKK
jgi:LCP family protein required for cell wall assembly